MGKLDDFDPLNQQQVSAAIDTIVQTISMLDSALAQFRGIREFSEVNDLFTAMNVPSFAPNFVLTPVEYLNALNALLQLLTALETALTPAHQALLAAIRSNIGVITGTG